MKRQDGPKDSRRTASRYIKSLCLGFPKAADIFRSLSSRGVLVEHDSHSDPSDYDIDEHVQEYAKRNFELLYPTTKEGLRDSSSSVSGHNGVRSESSVVGNREVDASINEIESEASNPQRKTLPTIVRESFTPYNIIFVSLIIGLGSWKAYANAHSHSIVGNVLDWVIGIVLTVMFVHFLFSMRRD